MRARTFGGLRPVSAFTAPDVALREVEIFEEKLQHQFYAVPHGWFVVAVQNPGRPVPPQEGNGLRFGALRSLFPLACQILRRFLSVVVPHGECESR